MDIQQSPQIPETDAQPRVDERFDGDGRGPLSTKYSGSAANNREIFLRGQRAFEHGDDGAALESFERLTLHGFEYADVYYRLGILHERRDDVDAAVESLRAAIRINPSYVEALLALASLFERRGDYDQAQQYAERASQLARPSGDGLDSTTRGKLANQQSALADALAQAGEKRDAIEEYRRALDRCPTFHDIRHRLGMTLREAGLPFQAAQEFRRILRVHAGMLDSQIQLGLTYYSMGRTPEAIAEWEDVLQMDASRDEARMYLRLVRGSGMRTARPSRLNLDGDLDGDPAISGWSTPSAPGGSGEPSP